MASTVLSSLVCILCLLLLPSVWADYCGEYWDRDGVYHEPQLCGLWYCCGDCNTRYCCSGVEGTHLTNEQLQDCVHSSRRTVKSYAAAYLAGFCALTFGIVLCVVLLICCLCPRCLIYKKFQKSRHQAVATNPNLPAQAHPPYTHPGYQPVPAPPGYGGLPVPTAPPHSYMEATPPGPSPLGHPMNTIRSPAEYPPPPPYSEDLDHPPYNPSFAPTGTS